MAMEFFFPGFIIFWFGIGGILTAILSFSQVLKNTESQLIFFFIASFVLLASWVLFFKRLFT
jgi:membrane protein implicated in regulation of membrane protease activity